MILDINRALSIPGVEHAFDISLSEAEGEMKVLFPDGVRVWGTVMGAGETVFVRGTVEALIDADCARCLTPIHVAVTAPLDEVYAKEVDPDDPEKLAYSGHTLDISEQVHAAFLLNMPMRFLCREDCPGLCPGCGANLSQGSCSCQKELPQQHPFSALQSLLTEDEEV